MTRAQKEQYVIEFYKQDKTLRDYQTSPCGPSWYRCHKKKVKLKVEWEWGQLDEKDDYDTELKTKITQAIKLFSEGKTPVDVVTDIGSLLPSTLNQN